MLVVSKKWDLKFGRFLCADLGPCKFMYAAVEDKLQTV